MKRIQFKHIVVGCMLAALLAVPTMAFAAPSADDAAASDPAVVEQQNGVENAGLPEATSGGDNVTADAPADGENQTTAPDNAQSTGGNTELGTDTTDGTDADAPEDGTQDASKTESNSSTPVYYYIVGGCVVALGIGFYIALTVKQKKR